MHVNNDQRKLYVNKYKRGFLISLKAGLFIGFFYLWDYWTAMLLFFGDTDDGDIVDYLFTLIFNISILLSCFRCHILLKIVCLLLLFFTTYLYVGILVYGKAWGFACIGIGTNSVALFFMWYNWKTTHEKIIFSKN